MKPEKAEKIMALIKQDRIPVNELDELRACNLGIKALALYRNLRKDHPGLVPRLLPGETDD